MPIRFRCAYCNQLMGIARRKAGTVVSCPNCAGQVVVPTEDDAPAMTSGMPPAASKTEQPAPFERGDFDDLFGRKPIQSPMPSPKRAPAPAPVPAPILPPPILKQTAPMVPPPAPEPALPPPPRLDFPPLPPLGTSGQAPVLPPPPIGYVVSPSMATLLSVAIIVALALAFTAGLLVGRFYLQPPSDDDSPAGRRNMPAAALVCASASNPSTEAVV